MIDLQVGYPGHPSIPYANYVLDQYGKKTGAWEATFSNDLANFQYAKLRQYDAIFLNNTVGMLFADPEVRTSIVRFLKEGGGLAGYHASTHASIDWPEFTEIIGASSGAHREATEKVTVKLDDPASPINAAFGGQEFESIDEHFRWSNYSRARVHVLLSIDVPKTDLNQGRGCDICTRADGDYAISWIRSYGKGRVFYSSLGHAPTAFMDSRMVGHFMAGVQFALGDLDADTHAGKMRNDETLTDCFIGGRRARRSSCSRCRSHCPNRYLKARPPLPGSPNLEKPLGKPRPPFLAPAGTTNLALHKPVSGSDSDPVIGALEMVTDGNKAGTDGTYVELKPGVQNMVIDLEAKCTIYAVLIWHFHKEARAYAGVVVQVADDPDFISNVGPCSTTTPAMKPGAASARTCGTWRRPRAS